MRTFIDGIKAILPITAGVIPFGAVMGAVFSDAGLSFFQAMMMNSFVFAGASQLAAIDLMTKNAESLVIIITGVMINLRFMLYSAALSPMVQTSNLFVKVLAAYCITDQNYTVMTAHQERLPSNIDKIKFYFGTSFGMILAWQVSVILGYTFGNFAPPSWSLDYAVPVSFVALVIPTIKNKNYVLVALCSAILSLFLKPMPYNLGLIATAAIAIMLAIFLSKPKKELK